MNFCSLESNENDSAMTRYSRYISLVILSMALLVLARCGKDSPTRSKHQPTPARVTAAQDGASQDGASQDGTSQDGVSPDGTSQAGTSQDGASQAGTSQDGVSSAGPSQDAVVAVTTADSDRAALIALYNATNGPAWTNNDNWLGDRPLGDWHGVEIDTEGRVTRVSLDENNLHGSLPPEIGQLEKLNDLSFRGNRLSGSLPIELGNLGSLTRMDVASNQLTGTVPAGISELANLRALDLQSNRFTGPMPSRYGRHISYLALGGNEFTGPVPSELSRYTALDVLNLAYNRLTGPIPPELGRLSKLRWLWLSSNQLTGSIPSELGSLTALTHLRLSDNPGLSGTLPATLVNLPLESLRLGGTSICAPQASEIQAWLRTIREHDAINCIELDVSALTAFYNSTDGPNWTNDENWLSDASLNDWFGVTTDDTGRVRGLDLADNNLRGPLPPEIAAFSELDRMR